VAASSRKAATSAADPDLDAPQAVAFLGGFEARTAWRRSVYSRLRPALSPGAREYWDARRRVVARGVLGAGVSERFIHLIVVAIRALVHPPSRIRRLLACRTLAEQQELYTREWDNRRWRLLFSVLLNRVVFRHTYDPGFFQHVENSSFARHFRRLIEHVLVNVPWLTTTSCTTCSPAPTRTTRPRGCPPTSSRQRGHGPASSTTDSRWSTGPTRTTCAHAPTPASTPSRCPTSASGSTPPRSTSCWAR